MSVSTDILRTWFEEFNRDYFNSSLPEPKITTGKSRTQLGTMGYKWKSVMGFKKYYDYTIRISNYYDVSEIQFKNVLLHEMIHYYIVFMKINDTSSHGIIFRRIMNRINSQGWNISVRTDTRAWKVADDKNTVHEKFVVLAVVTNTGKHILSVVSPGYVHRLGSILRISHDVKSYAFYTSCDKYFSSFPKVRSPRGRVVSPSLFMEKTEGAVPMETPSVSF